MIPVWRFAKGDREKREDGEGARTSIKFATFRQRWEGGSSFLKTSSLTEKF